ncbi:MAG: hypothetical protein ACLT5L_08760 [Streptococcus lutetiensis]|uniref:hypothetical protein n=1 Tax=[Ruminococcus] torques TaxID=33039 RepID=UPI0032BFD54C|nr:hypothetical protein [Enterococcus faecium]
MSDLTQITFIPFFLLITHNRKEKALSRALPPLVVLCTLDRAFCLLYLLARGKRLLVLVVKMAVF